MYSYISSASFLIRATVIFLFAFSVISNACLVRKLHCLCLINFASAKWQNNGKFDLLPANQGTCDCLWGLFSGYEVCLCARFDQK
uniref:Uncharacterized protein n=1 Tax=Poecilia mexicana TaxID=48701 RepID=A0A3B3YLK5_9TELE